MSTPYQWQEAYKAALLETDWSKMGERIQIAESALRDRERDLLLDHGGTAEENRALAEAMNSLLALKTESAGWSNQEEAS